MSEPTTPEYEFDVAVSFAGEDRALVEEVVSAIKAAQVRVFYDSDYLAETWGEDLVEYFDDVYRNKARYAIMFISRHYAEKMWCRHERRSALARALEQRGAYVLPVRLDDTDLDGLRPTVGYLDARRVGIGGIVKATLTKVQGAPPPTIEITRVPRTEAEQQLLLLERPGGWEYLYFASELLRQRDALEHKYRDHEMRFAASTGLSIRRGDIADYLQGAAGEAARLAESLGAVMSAEAQERAFGAPGAPGDADRVLHLASRWTAIYDGFLDWTARLRGTVTPSEYSDLVDALSHYSDASIENYRKFVDDFVEQVDRVPAALAADEKLEVDMTLLLEIPEEVLEKFQVELARALGGAHPALD